MIGQADATCDVDTFALVLRQTSGIAQLVLHQSRFLRGRNACFVGTSKQLGSKRLEAKATMEHQEDFLA